MDKPLPIEFYMLIFPLYISTSSKVSLNLCVLNKIATLQTESYLLTLRMFELFSECTPTLRLCNILPATYVTA
jgi:hypothetical protein